MVRATRTATGSVVADTVAPEFARFLGAQVAAGRRSPPDASMAAGEIAEPIFATAREGNELLSIAAKRAVGLFRPTKRTEVVWVNADSQLAVGLVGLDLETSDGFMTVSIPVRCDQVGSATVEVTFATGRERSPAGLFAATHRRPVGPALVVEVWGEHLVAFAWQCVLGLLSGLSGAAGKDGRGNVLVPAELTVNSDGLQIVPMARHRFAGSSGLLTKKPVVIGRPPGGDR